MAEKRLSDKPSSRNELAGKVRDRLNFMTESSRELNKINVQLDVLGQPARSSLGFHGEGAERGDVGDQEEENVSVADAEGGYAFSDAPSVMGVNDIPDPPPPSLE